MARLLQGKVLAISLKNRLKEAVSRQVQETGSRPILACIQVGQDKAQRLYLKQQEKTAAEIDVGFRLIDLEEDVDPDELKLVIDGLNQDPHVHGIILQQPLPRRLSSHGFEGCLNPLKDVEGVHPENLGLLFKGNERFKPCTAMAVLELLELAECGFEGKEAVVVGHSAIVGKPVSLMLLNRLATTTVCHIATSDRGLLSEHVKRAELLIVAVGKPGLIAGSWIRPGAVVVDVGVNVSKDGRVCGDVEFETARERASLITPVPGGVGPLTVAMLMKNLIEAFNLQREVNEL